MSYGEKAVGLTFNPSNNDQVELLKRQFADVIDTMHFYRVNGFGSAEQQRMLSIAITEAQTAQMWAVKAVTWKD